MTDRARRAIFSAALIDGDFLFAVAMTTECDLDFLTVVFSVLLRLLSVSAVFSLFFDPGGRLRPLFAGLACTTLIGKKQPISSKLILFVHTTRARLKR